MLYDSKRRVLLARDGSPVKKRAVDTVRRYQRQSLESLTPGEQEFCRLMSGVCAKTKARYVKQPVEYITEGISFRLDFLFRDYRVAVEIDGDSHLGAAAREKDDWRTRLIGYTVLRFTNFDVTERYLWVRAQVVQALLDAPEGYKRLLMEYAVTMRGHPDYARQRDLGAMTNP